MGEGRTARLWAAGWAGATSLGLLLVVLARPRVGLNPLSGWTIVVGLTGAVFGARSGRRTLGTAVLLVAAAALPALVGGLGLLYAPALLLLCLSGVVASERRPIS